jgi:hypothetical protein
MATEQVIRDAPSWQAYWADLPNQIIPFDVPRELPLVDFRTEIVIAVTMGLRPSSGFSVSIGISGSHVPFNRLMASSGHLSCRMPLRRKQVSAELIPQ